MPTRATIHRPAGIMCTSRHTHARKTAERGYGGPWQRIRAWFLANHPPICVHCGFAGQSNEMHLDHIVPKAKGGTDDEENLQWLCGICNSAKRDKDDEIAKRQNVVNCRYGSTYGG